MNVSFKQLITDGIVRWIGGSTLFLIVFAVLITAVFYAKLPPFLPLYNQQPWGEMQLGRRVDIFLPLLLAFVIFLFNTTIASYLYEKMPLTSRLLFMTSFFIAFFAFLLTVRTLLLVI